MFSRKPSNQGPGFGITSGWGNSVQPNSGNSGHSGYGALSPDTRGPSTTAFGASGLVPSANPELPAVVKSLVQSIQRSQSSDRLLLTFGVEAWHILSTHLMPFTVAQGQVLMEQGSKDTSVFIVETGQLSVHYQDMATSAVQLAMVAPGSVVGEGAFFSGEQRNATVTAMAPSKLWRLSPQRFQDLSRRHPAVALGLVLALGSVVSRRLGNRPKRAAIT